MTTEEVKWNVGDPCRAVFPDDGLEYEATIESLGESDGVPFANVVFLFYGNQQVQFLMALSFTSPVPEKIPYVPIFSLNSS